MSYDLLSPEAARLWAYAPDWSRGFNVRRQFSTDIAPSRDNTEQRRALINSPRLSAEYSTVVADEDKRGVDLFLRAWQNKPTVVPDFARWARLTASSAGGASTITIDPMPAWVAEGQTLILCAPGETEQVLVESAAGTTVTLADPLSQAWADQSVVRPAFFGLFEGEMRSSRITRGTASVDVRIQAYPGGEPPRAAGTAWATFNGREVFTLQPDHVGPPSLDYLFPVEQVDFGRGRTAQFRPVDRAERSLQADFTGQDVTAATELEQFFDRMKGRRNSFYMPTWEQDFALAETAASGSSSFLAGGSDLASFFGAVDYAEVETAIAVCLTDGTQLYRLVTDIAAESGNSRVTVSAAWPSDLTAATVARICWMPIWRFASDEMVTGWRTPLSANVRLSFLSVKR